MKRILAPVGAPVKTQFKYSEICLIIESREQSEVMGDDGVNKAKLKEAEERFNRMYPGGFSNPEMAAIAKKHRVEKMHELALESFSPEKFRDTEGVVEAIGNIVKKSSLVSVFEKVRFRDLVPALNEGEKERLARGLREFLHGDQKLGFELMAGLLEEYKLAKWPLLTVCPYYYSPDVEVLIKPTTVKGSIEYFELEGLKYSPHPNYEFYRAYRDEINRMKKVLKLSPHSDNGAFCGFLMMSIEKEKNNA